MTHHLLSGPEHDPARDAGHEDAPPRVGFFTDTSVCIGCKACEVACKEWNTIPEDGLTLTGMSYDNTQSLGASTWRHVAFIEQSVRSVPSSQAAVPTSDGRTELPLVSGDGGGGGGGGVSGGEVRWLMSSDVCKHCTHAACLDVCPTGSLFRTEFGTVVVQDDICNGCGYCVPACPYGVIEQRPSDGRAFKCTMCYDRLGAGMEPACAKACPTESIQFGVLDELRERAALRVDLLHKEGVTEARLYGHDPDDGVGGDGAFFLLLDEPEVYGLPPAPVVTTRDLPAMWKHAATAALSLMGGFALSFGLAALPALSGRTATGRTAPGRTAPGRTPVGRTPTGRVLTALTARTLTARKGRT
ncbi:4Fe-4S dicluster domain-containing protein [Streptomyces sp. NPDC056672]|uniref:4Fe-4S dicluster domain-containing protein n=1 Tax=Streptomyces sp. NPDC056672 TaxID=3345906 RepID=UPI00368A5C5B